MSVEPHLWYSLVHSRAVTRVLRGKISRPLSTEEQFPPRWEEPAGKSWQVRGMSVRRKEARAAGGTAQPRAQGETGRQITGSPEEGCNVAQPQRGSQTSTPCPWPASNPLPTAPPNPDPPLQHLCAAPLKCLTSPRGFSPA